MVRAYCVQYKQQAYIFVCNSAMLMMLMLYCKLGSTGYPLSVGWVGPFLLCSSGSAQNIERSRIFYFLTCMNVTKSGCLQIICKH